MNERLKPILASYPPKIRRNIYGLNNVVKTPERPLQMKNFNADKRLRMPGRAGAQRAGLWLAKKAAKPTWPGATSPANGFSAYNIALSPTGPFWRSAKQSPCSLPPTS